MKLLQLSLCLLFAIMSGCASNIISISEPTLSVASVTQKNEDAFLYPGTFVSLVFRSDAPIDTSDTIIQFRGTVINEEQEVGISFAMGPFVSEGQKILFGQNGSTYTAFFFKDLAIPSDHGAAMSISETQFDRIEFQLVNPSMLAGAKPLSNTITFSKAEVLEILNDKPIVFTY
ncbi:hypothetical protein BTA51_11780 [Hahella sp. CCB-MM4]|uniref:hypothetical protein n=1 Tax=Hahella sp. (strain CCB-MM4) TaxID=1926491 RepID=UPI000B9ACC32|nr:hypothetical protein [Hahella sp. CCB-MM4]OZG73165.1 hypothetical protein BTA51_11780 [Hahella sp. CCB-MM4]